MPPPEPEWSDLPSHVHHLTDDSFDDFVKEHDSVLVMFYAPCKFCTCLPLSLYLTDDSFEHDCSSMAAISSGSETEN